MTAGYGQTLLGSLKNASRPPCFSKTFPAWFTTDFRLAYAAGLMDGDGCISLVKGSRATFNGNRVYWYIVVTVGMAKKGLPVLEMLRSLFGGKVEKCRAETLRHAAKYRWRLHGRGATTFLWAICPFLVLKQEQAQLALRLEELRASIKRGKSEKGQRWWTPEKEAEAEQLHQRAKELNRKGPD